MGNSIVSLTTSYPTYTPIAIVTAIQQVTPVKVAQTPTPTPSVATVVATDGKTYRVVGLTAEYHIPSKSWGGAPTYTTTWSGISITLYPPPEPIKNDETIEIAFTLMRSFRFEETDVRIEMQDGSLILLSPNLFEEKDARGNITRSIRLHRFSLGRPWPLTGDLFLILFKGWGKTENGKEGAFELPLYATRSITFDQPLSASPMPTQVLPAATPTRVLPTVIPSRIPPTPTGTPLKIELSEADLKGKVKFTITGDGLESIHVTLELTGDEPLEVTIIPGTIFQAMSGAVQNMVVRELKTVLLKSRGVKVTVEVEVACANMELDEPKANDTFTIRRQSTDPDLVKLLSLPDFHRETFSVQQFAIWTITDNPSRNGYVGIGSFGLGSGPTTDEFQKIRTLFAKGSISISKYQAFR